MGAITKAAEVAKTAPAEVSRRETVRQLLDTNKGAIGMSLPSAMNADRFSRLLLTAGNTNPELFECNPVSFLAAGVAAAQLGLEPNDARGLAYLVPFKRNWKDDKGNWQTEKVVNLIIGYRGMMDLARRSGMVSSIRATAVFEGDQFDYSLGLEPTLRHIPSDTDEDPAKLTHVYAVAKINGDPQFVVLTRRQVDKARSASKGSDSKSSPWTTYYAEMACKTAIRRLCKMLPQTVELAQATSLDERPLHLGDLGYVTADDDTDPVNDSPTPELHPGAIDVPEGVNPETGEMFGGDA